MEAYGGVEVWVHSFLSLTLEVRCAVRFTPPLLYPEKTTVLTEQEAGRAPEAVSNLRSTEKFFAPARNRATIT